MHESSAEYVMQRVNKDLRGKRTVSVSSRLRTLLNEKKWQVIFGSCLILTITAVAIPAGVSHTLRESGPQPSPPHNTAAQGEPAEGRAKKRRVDHGNTAAETAKRLQPVAHAAPLNRRKPGTKKQQESQAALINHLKPGTKKQQDTQAAARNDKTPGAKKQQEAFNEHKQGVSVQAEGIYRFSPVPETAPGDHYVKDLRLPKTVEPLEYKLKFEPVYTDQSVFFKGHARIFILCKENTKMIQMHASNLIIDRSNSSLTTVDQKPGPEILNIRTNDFSQFLYIYLADDIIAGEKYYLNIPFTSITFHDNGFNVRHYTRDNDTPLWVIGTNFLPTEARSAFPCFDEPGLKSVFNMEVIRDPNLHTLSNMPLAKVYPKSKGKQADTFVKTFPMSTFSVGFFISDFVSYGNTSFKLWTRPGILKDVDFLLELGPKILKFYETYFAMPYQVPKMDVVAMEHYINDVQNMGLLYLPENIAFYDPEEASVVKRQSVLLALCHAFSHEWFGNLVTPEWWDDVWVMDGFATYFQYRCLENFDRTPKSYHLMVINDVISVMKHDIIKYSPAIVTEVDTQYRIYQAFNVFSTQKAVAVLRMLDMAMGENIFKRGIHDILTSRMFQSVTSQMIWDALTEVQPKKRPLDVKRIMEAWTNQSGFPVLSVTRIYDENSATLIQSKFSLEAEERESKNLWPIPITFVTSEDRSFNKTRPVIWLNEKEGQLENLASPHNWVLFNNLFSGYYKINYDERNWELLIRQLLWNHTFIDPLNRAQIQNDLFDLAKAGMVNYTLALEATKYLLREQDFIPWKTAFDKMKDVGVYLHTTGTYSKWKERSLFSGGLFTYYLQEKIAEIGW
ncbi:aminopeptidase Ey-like [Ixodes scapularis]|uniref:aminopeptidase Ey-like n=1 Tax=Ixodes scapularis TaxID=6945 RepID=UPI001C38F70C|nr:aminopeptidase Ey-like [Ixodes scapularis]